MTVAQIKVAAMLLLVSLATWKIWWWGYDTADQKHKAEAAQQQVASKDAVIKQHEAVRAENTRRAEVVEVVDEKLGAENARLAGELDGAERAADGLQRQLDDVKRRYSGAMATCDARIANQQQARDRAIDLLTELYSESDKRAGELAKEADRARTAGLGCEAVYDGVREQPKQPKNGSSTRGEFRDPTQH